MNEHVRKWIIASGFSFDKIGEDLLVYTSYEDPFLVISKTMFCQKTSDDKYYISLNKQEIEHAKQRATMHQARLLYFISIMHPQFGFLKYLVPEFSLIYFEAATTSNLEVNLIIDDQFIERLPLGFISLSK